MGSFARFGFGLAATLLVGCGGSASLSTEPPPAAMTATAQPSASASAMAWCPPHAARTLAEKLADPADLATDDSGVYLVSYSGLERIRKPDATHELLIASYGTSIAVDTDAVYCACNGLQRVDKRTQAVTTLNYDSTDRVVVDDSAIYLLAAYGGLVKAMDKHGANFRTLGATALDSGFGLMASDEQALYVSQVATGPDSPVYRVDKHGGSKVIAMGGVLRGLTGTGDNVYFTDETAQQVSRVATAGGSVQAFSTGGYPNAITTDKQYIYWIREQLTADDTYVGDVLAQPIVGGEAQTLASFTGYAAGIAVSSDCVYWITGGIGTGALLSTAKP
ncbi:MAG: hypothetical protein ABJB12_17225 [Pseudomonadota bacterium]